MTNWLPTDATADDLRAVFESFSDDEFEQVRTDWRGLWARENQIMPAGDWANWVLLGGRGSGKTRPGAEAVREMAMSAPDLRIALVGPTSADCRDVMVNGESGLMSVFPEYQRPEYFPSRRLIVFPNRTQGTLFSAEEPERLRGPAHHFAWCDEIATYPHFHEVWSNLKFGLRLGTNPRVVATTTPKPLRWLKELVNDPGTVVSRMTTQDNRANLSPAALAELERIYAGTRIGRQELEGELLEEAEGALWSRGRIEELRVREHPGDTHASVARSGGRGGIPELKRIVVAIDPSTTSGPESDEVGMIVAALGIDGEGYVLQDLSGRFAPDEWATRAISAYDKWQGDRIVAEANQGGDMIESVLKTIRRNVSYTKVHASRGKTARAEPIAALYEQGKCHHCGGFAELEDEMVNFVPGALVKSPNRADALVWAFSDLMLKPPKVGKVAWM